MRSMAKFWRRDDESKRDRIPLAVYEAARAKSALELKEQLYGSGQHIRRSSLRETLQYHAKPSGAEGSTGTTTHTPRPYEHWPA